MADTIHLLTTGHYKRIISISYSPTIQYRVKPDLLPENYLGAAHGPDTTLEKLEAVVKSIGIEFQIPDHEQILDQFKHF
jgi:hypothetical protein